MSEKIYDYLAARINPTVVFFFIYAIFLISPFLYGGPNALEGHDFHFHKHVIHQMGLAFDGGQFPARIMPDLAFGFGYGIGIFYPPLAHLAGYLFSLLPSFDIHMAVTAVYFMVYFFSGYAFYKMMLYIGKTKSAAAIGGLLYMSAPYLIINILYRDAYAEAFCFMFLPLVLIGLVKLVREQKILMLALSFSAIAVTHNITTLYTLVFILLGCLVYFRHFMKRKVIIAGLKAAGLVLLLAAFAIIPIIEHRFFNTGVIYNTFSTAKHLVWTVPQNALQIGQLLYWPFGQSTLHWSLYTSEFHNQLFHNRMPIFIGAHLLLLFMAAVLWPSSKRTLRANIPAASAALLALFATTVLFPWQWVPQTLLHIQFPWRLFSFAGFFICIVAADVFSQISAKNLKFPMAAIALIGMFYTVRIASPIPVKPKMTPEAGANIGVEEAPEYNPSPFIGGSGPLMERGNMPLAKHGHAAVSNFERDRSGRLSFSVDMLENTPDIIELPLLYYKGYQVRFIPRDGGSARILPNFANERGMVAVRADSSGTLKTRYRGTPADKIATSVSLAALLLLIIAGIASVLKKSAESSTSRRSAAE